MVGFECLPNCLSQIFVLQNHLLTEIIRLRRTRLSKSKKGRLDVIYFSLMRHFYLANYCHLFLKLHQFKLKLLK